MKRTLIAFVGAIGLTLAAPGTATAGEEIVISAGTKGSPYYRLGQAICMLLNRKAEAVSCDVVPMSAGDADESLASIVNLRDGAVEIGIARSDWLHFAVTGTGPTRFMDTKFDTIRSLFSIDRHPFTLLAKRDSGIGRLNDLRGRRVNLGKRHSQYRASMDLIMGAMGWTMKDFALAEELTPAEQSLSFCHDRVESVFYLVRHPDTAVRRLTRLCNAAIIDVSGPPIDKLVSEHPYLAVTTIPGGLYEGMPGPVKTFGTTITVVSSSEVSADLVYSVVKAVFDNLQALKEIYPALHYLDPTEMFKDGISAPLHAGAQRYFRERGLL